MPQEVSRSRTVAKCFVQRATIILPGFQGRLNEEIAPQVGLNRQQVGADGEWIFLADCLHTHMSESLVQWVAEQCGLPDELGKKV